MINDIEWRTPLIGDLPMLKRLSFNNNFSQNDYNALNTVFYAKKFKTEIAFIEVEGETFLVKKFSSGENTFYCTPQSSSGGDFYSERAALLEHLISEAKGCGTPFILSMVSTLDKDFLSNIFPNSFLFVEERDNEDYIYNRNSLMTLTGKKYSKKRNHISQFLRTYKAIRFTPLTKENIKDALEIEKEWLSTHESPDTFFESDLINRILFVDYDEIKRNGVSLMGGVLYADDRPCAFSIATATSDRTVDVHFEKALEPFAHDGGYAVVNCEAAKTFSGFQKINREEDMGLPGLRKAKLSYHPDMLFQKWRATL